MYLGMTFEERLDWRPHVASLTKKFGAVRATDSEVRNTTVKSAAIIVYAALLEAYLRYRCT